MVLHAVGFAVLPGIEGQGQREYLPVHGLAPAAGGGHGVDAISPGDVDEVHAGVVLLRDANHVAEGHVLHLLGVDQVGVPPVPHAPLMGQQVVVHHDFIVFGVDGEYAIVSVTTGR